MVQKDFFLGVIVTLLIGAIAAIILLIMENRRLKSGNMTTPIISNPPNEEIREADNIKSEIDGGTNKEEVSNQNCSDKKYVYPDPSGIPIEWYNSVHKLKNDWVNEIATANLLQIRSRGNLGDVVVIANCKFVDKRTEGFRLILEDPYETIKTELVPANKIPENEVDGFVGNILIVNGVSKDGKFIVKRIRKTNFARKIT